MTSNNILTEVNTKSVEPYISNLFSSTPVDSRYTKIELRRFEPVSVGQNTNNMITNFTLQSLPQPQAYMWQDMLISVKIKILQKATKTLPPKNAKISVIDNILGSLFSKVLVHLNIKQVDQDQDYYFLKAYLEQVLSYGQDSQTTWLEGTNGFTLDRFQSDENDHTKHINTGFEFRRNLFKEGRSASGEWSPNGLQLCGKLYHEFSNCNKPLPFGNTLELKFTRTSDEILLFQEDPNDQKEYIVDIQEFALYVPVATWTEALCRGIIAKWDKEPIRYHYKSYVITRRSLPKSNSMRITSLFTETVRPSRVFLAVQYSYSMEPGALSNNPFEFRRNWTYHTEHLEQKLKLKEKHDFSKTLKETARLAAETAAQRAEMAASKKIEEMTNKMLAENARIMQQLMMSLNSNNSSRRAQPVNNEVNVAPSTSRVPLVSSENPTLTTRKDDNLPVKGIRGRKRKNPNLPKDLVVGGKTRGTSTNNSRSSVRSSRSSRQAAEEQEELEHQHREMIEKNSFITNSNQPCNDDDPDFVVLDHEEETSEEETDGQTLLSEEDEDQESISSGNIVGNRIRIPKVHVRGLGAPVKHTLELKKIQLQLQQQPLGLTFYCT